MSREPERHRLCLVSFRLFPCAADVGGMPVPAAAPAQASASSALAGPLMPTVTYASQQQSYGVQYGTSQQGMLIPQQPQPSHAAKVVAPVPTQIQQADATVSPINQLQLEALVQQAEEDMFGNMHVTLPLSPASSSGPVQPTASSQQASMQHVPVENAQMPQLQQPPGEVGLQMQALAAMQTPALAVQPEHQALQPEHQAYMQGEMQPQLQVQPPSASGSAAIDLPGSADAAISHTLASSTDMAGSQTQSAVSTGTGMLPLAHTGGTLQLANCTGEDPAYVPPSLPEPDQDLHQTYEQPMLQQPVPGMLQTHGETVHVPAQQVETAMQLQPSALAPQV